MNQDKSMIKITLEYQLKIRVDLSTLCFRIRKVFMVQVEMCISYATNVYLQYTSVFIQILLKCYSPKRIPDTMITMSGTHRMNLGHNKYLLLYFQYIQKSVLWLWKYNLIWSNPGRNFPNLWISYRLGISVLQFTWT